MKERLLITTAVGLMLGTAAFAQSPNEQPRTNSPPAAQSQSNPDRTNSGSSQTNSNTAAPSSAGQSAPSSSAASSPDSTPSAQNAQSQNAPNQNAQSTPSDSQKSTASQSAPTTSGNSDSNRAQAPSSQNSGSGQAQNSNAGTAPSQSQSDGQLNQSSQGQANTASPANNQTTSQSQQAPSANTNAATQPSNNAGVQPAGSQPNTAQSNTNINLSANLNDTQRTRVSESITRLNVKPVTNVNFSLSVGTVVPRDVHFQPLPAEVVEVMPQYRGYNFVVVRDDIVIVEPSSYKIVDVLPRRAQSTAGAPASQSTAATPTSRKTTFSESDREVIRKHSRSRAEQPRAEQRTTGSSSTSTRVRVGDRLPDSVEVRSFSDEVHRDSPTLREYRYIERDNRTYVVEPQQRTIIEEIE